MRPTPRVRLCFSLLVLCGLSLACAEKPIYARPPIIIIDIDTLRADHLGCYGYERATSPRIDAFAEEAVRFEWAFAQAPNTPPSQTSILTGLYPTTHGRIGNYQLISEEIVTLAEVLQADGYATAAFVDGGLMSARYGYDQGFDSYDDEAGHLRRIAPKLGRWIRGYLAGREQPTRPFFLLVHTYDTHSPYEESPEPHRSMFLAEVEAPPTEFRKRVSATMAGLWERRHEEDPPLLGDAELDWAVALYDGGIHHVDHWFGRFIDMLRRRGILDQAIVVVISDHGEEFQEHGAIFHERLYATVTRIPLIIRFPQGRNRGVRGEVVESIDLMPTLLDAVGAPVPERVQGRSLMPMIGGAEVEARIAFSESPYYGRRIAATGADHRLMFALKRPGREFFSYREDPLEQENLSARGQRPEVKLMRHIYRWNRRMLEGRYPRSKVETVDESEKEQLKALGYLR